MSAFGDALDEFEPPYEDQSQQPKTLTKTGHKHNGKVLYVAGRFPQDEPQQCDIMFVTTSVDEDEATTVTKSMLGYRINTPAEYLKGPTGILRDVALRAGLDMDKFYYTALCKWLLPRAKRNAPPVKVCKWGLPVLMDEIERVKPKIIVCLGKQPFDLLSDRKLNFKDAHGGWFWSSEAQCHLYLMNTPWSLISKPEMYEMFRVDFAEIQRKHQILLGNTITELPVRGEIIANENDLTDWVQRRIEAEQWLYCVDGEWHGRTHVDGQLRTFQFAWTESDAMLLEFRDEKNQFSFEFNGDTIERLTALASAEVDAWVGPNGPTFEKAYEKLAYLEIGEMLKPLLHRPEVRYIGHHISADWPWMVCTLGIDVWGRCVMDTEFAQQAVDEASELGLERGIGMKYTTLGLYNLELVLWKKENKKLCEDGYGFIPKDILYPYAIRDVLAPFRAYPIIRKQMDYQQLSHYHDTILLPFISDVFTDFAITGLPMDIPLMDELRELFHFAKGVLEVEFRKTMERRATSLLRNALVKELGVMNGIAVAKKMQGKDFHEALDIVKGVIDLKNVNQWIKLLEHFYDSPAFNIRSPDQMRRWLFDVEKLTPIKSTNQKAKGMPSQSWDKVLELPEDRQKLFTPAVDKQTLQILAQQCGEINELLDLNVVGNLCKAFLKEAEEYLDEETGEMVVDEHGLHQWLASDGRIHGQCSLTGTGRPRTWMPNTLNFPSYVNERIGRAVIRATQKAHADGTLPESLLRWVNIKDEKDLPSIRSCITAPEGWILTESDYATAEMVALAKVSGDKDLERILEEPDPEWAELKPGNPLGKYVRIRYASEGETGIPKHKQNPEYIMTVWKDGEFVGKASEDDLARNPDGSVKHRGYDIHWSIAERIYERPREEMIEKIYRNAAKVINFSSAYGASPASLERKIESDTGVKPEEGVGQKGLDAIRMRQPRSTEFLEEMAEVPKKKGYYRAASGRICHCVTHSAGSGVGWRQRNATESSLGREMRNYPMQESVASTAARAGRMLRKLYLKLGLKAKPITILYDSVVTLCPLEERFVVARLHTLCMSELNTWDYEDEIRGKRTLKYSVENEFNYRWSTRPSKAQQKILDDPTFHPTPDRLKWTLTYANWPMLVS